MLVDYLTVDVASQLSEFFSRFYKVNTVLMFEKYFFVQRFSFFGVLQFCVVYLCREEKGFVYINAFGIFIYNFLIVL